jgi:hypothetical protein
MFKLLSFRFAVNGLALLLSIVIVFHLLVMSGIIPYTIVWAGKLQSTREMLLFESISILLNLLLLLVVTMKGGYIAAAVPQKVLNAILWVFIVLFSLNTIGNMMAKYTLETILFTPLTFFSAILCTRIVMEKAK